MAIIIKDDKIIFDDGRAKLVIKETVDGFSVERDFINTSLVAPGFASIGSQGAVSGYVAGGIIPSVPLNNINKFSFAIDANASEVGSLATANTIRLAGHSSSSHGYTSGGSAPPGSNTQINVIEKFPFASDSNASDVGDLTEAKDGTSGHSSTEHGYVANGRTFDGPPAIFVNTIERFPFSVDSNASDIGDLSRQIDSAAGSSSRNYGFIHGGRTLPNAAQPVYRFTFVSSVTIEDSVGSLSLNRYLTSAQMSTTHGYTSGGFAAPTFRNTIDKFPIVSGTTSTDVGDLTAAKNQNSGQSSFVNGYVSGGGPGTSNTIEKFPFASDTNASDVGDLVNQVGNSHAGMQY